MNYIREINAFYDWIETNTISDSAINLWHALMHMNNKASWVDQFTVSLSTLGTKTGLSKSSIIRARAILIEKGRITCIQRAGQLSAIYIMNSLHKDTQTDLQMEIMKKVVVPEETQSRTKNGKKPAVVVPQDTLTGTDNKLNTISKTKHSVGTGVPTPKKETVKTLYWQKIVDTWFNFYKSKFELDPTFNGAQSKNLKQIVGRLEKLSKTVVLKEGGNPEWTEEYCVRILNKFFKNAYEKDQWMKDNFLLTNLYSKFDTIISKNGTATTGNSGVEKSVTNLLSKPTW